MKVICIQLGDNSSDFGENDDVIPSTKCGIIIIHLSYTEKEFAIK